MRLLELGCGQGFSANLIAAANPHLDYAAIDFNPGHIAGARALGVRNVHFSEATFEEFAHDRSSGEFDIVTLHGIYSWVSVENLLHGLPGGREGWLQPISRNNSS